MPVEIHAFLTAYRPNAICISCLSVVTERSDSDVRQTVTTLVTERRAETLTAECLNCNETSFVVRSR